MTTRGRLAIALLKAAALYLLVGLVLGLAMAITRDFRLASVHSHVLLLGWASLALTGIVYMVLPGCEGSRLARAHFWLHNLGMPVMLLSLVVATLGDERVEPLVGLGSVLVTAGLGCFIFNVLRSATAADLGA